MEDKRVMRENIALMDDPSFYFYKGTLPLFGGSPLFGLPEGSEGYRFHPLI